MRRSRSGSRIQYQPARDCAYAVRLCPGSWAQEYSRTTLDNDVPYPRQVGTQHETLYIPDVSQLTDVVAGGSLRVPMTFAEYEALGEKKYSEYYEEVGHGEPASGL